MTLATPPDTAVERKKAYLREYQRKKREAGTATSFHSEQWKEAHRKHQFVAVDGEGENTADGGHIYTMLCSSRGETLEDNAGLEFQRCADFLISLAGKYPLANMVMFSFNYDVHMMVKYLPKDAQVSLWKEHELQYGQYHLTWIPSKFLTISRSRRDKKTRKRNKESVTVWDSWGFFQMSFYNAIKEWKVADWRTAEDILNMKLQRGNFANVSKEQIKAYCLKECELLEKLMDTLYHAFRTASIPLRRYDGAGAAAAALLTKEKVGQHLERTPEIEQFSLKAYFGGRVELFRVGEYERVYNYDINSAYPYALTLLPSLRNGVWRRADYRPEEPFALWFVEWHLSDGEPLAPFPHRDRLGNIYYVRNGSGWYHSVEVDTAVRLFGAQIVPKYGYVFEPATDAKPFAFLQSLYDERRRRKERGDMSEKPLKLSMNGISGKLAQGRGYNGRKPRYQCFYWAGRVTATTRAQLLQLVYPIRHGLVGIATDGIFSLRSVKDWLDFGSGLGQWEANTYRDYFSCQAGVYHAWKEQGAYEVQSYACTLVARNRGFASREIDFNGLRKEYRRVGIGARVTYEPTRFVTIGGSLPNLEHVATWQPRKRQLAITYGKKWPADASFDRASPEYEQLMPGEPDEQESAPYRPKAGGWLDWTEVEAYMEAIEEW